MQNTPKRFPILFMPDYGLSLEYDHEVCLIHFEYFTKITPDGVKFLRWYAQEIENFVKDMGYDTIWAGFPKDNVKIVKLAQMCGFHHVTDNMNGDEMYTYYRRN